MAVSVVTDSDLSALVTYLKANCYKSGDIAIAAASDMTETEASTSVNDWNIKHLIRRDFSTMNGRPGYPLAIVDNVHIYGNSEIYEYMNNMCIDGWPMPMTIMPK